eukprot:8955912-Lingulodinium_polyedra.AAC.1
MAPKPRPPTGQTAEAAGHGGTPDKRPPLSNPFVKSQSRPSRRTTLNGRSRVPMTIQSENP